MSSFIQPIYNWIMEWKSLVTLLAGAVLFIVGIAYILPFESTKQFANKVLPYIVIGIGICFTAMTLVEEYAAKFVF